LNREQCGTAADYLFLYLLEKNGMAIGAVPFSSLHDMAGISKSAMMHLPFQCSAFQAGIVLSAIFSSE
jgi:hypothetical protein